MPKTETGVLAAKSLHSELFVVFKKGKFETTSVFYHLDCLSSDAIEINRFLSLGSHSLGPHCLAAPTGLEIESRSGQTDSGHVQMLEIKLFLLPKSTLECLFSR